MVMTVMTMVVLPVILIVVVGGACRPGAQTERSPTNQQCASQQKRKQSPH
jgi:hypothetical protein